MPSSPHNPRASEPHPFLRLLARRPVRTVWIGLAVSALGDELYRVGAIWLSISIAGSEAAYLPASQFTAMLVMSAAAGVIIDRYLPSSVMIGADAVRAVVCFIPVGFALVYSLTLPVLVFSAVALAAMRALFEPSLQFSLPQLAKEQDELRAINGLFDATVRLARLVGPFLAGLLSIVAPIIHLLTANAITFVVSALSIAAARKALNPPAPPARMAEDTIQRRLLHGFAVLNAHPDLRVILTVHTINFGVWILGVTIGLPLLVAQGMGARGGVTVVGLIFGAYGVGDFVSNILVTAKAPRHPWRFMFFGYVLMGCMLAAVPASQAMPISFQLPAMAGFAFLSGLGGPIYFIQMMTTIQRRLTDRDLASVLRLRMIATSASTVFFGLLGPAMFHALAAPLAVSTCGAVIAGSAVVGWRWGARRGLASTPVEVAAASRRKSRLAALRLAGSRLDHGRRKLVSSARLLSAWVSRLVEPTVRRFAAKLATAFERAIVRASKLLQ